MKGTLIRTFLVKNARLRMTKFLRNNFFGRLVESDLDRNSHFLREAFRQTDGQDFFPFFRHVNDAARYQTDMDVRIGGTEFFLKKRLNGTCENIIKINFFEKLASY
jgi:hypothetical protein